MDAFFVVIETYVVVGRPLLRYPVFSIIAMHSDESTALSFAARTATETGLRTRVIKAPVVYDSKERS